MKGLVIGYLVVFFLAACSSDKKDKDDRQVVNDARQEEEQIEDTATSESVPLPASIRILSESTAFFVGQSMQLEYAVTLSDGSVVMQYQGAVWSSSDETLATISAYGTLEAQAPGIVEVTLMAGGVDGYLEINILPLQMGMTAWVGGQDTQLELDAEVSEEIQVFSVSGATCLPYDCYIAAQEETCEDDACRSAELLAFSDGVVEGVTAHNTEQVPDYQIALGEYLSGVATWEESDIYSPRKYHQAVSFADKIFLTGGLDAIAEENTYLNDTWSSMTGGNFQQIQPEGGFRGREGHALTVFRDAMYLSGGWIRGGSELNDVWRSEDGITWEELTSSAEFPGRDSHQVVTDGSHMYLIGGWTEENGCDSYNDVWKSSDGVNWHLAAEEAAFSKRCNQDVTFFNDTFFLTGGVMEAGDSFEYLNDVWSSLDGANWTEEVVTSPFPERFKHQVVVFEDALVLIGGFDGSNSQATYYNDVWKSFDGRSWQRLTENAGFEGRTNHSAFVHEGYIYVMGGINEETTFTDVWRSNDGINWRKRVRGQFTFGE